MPNTLAHIALQGVPSHPLPRSFFVWILVGCVLPDLPWILNHILQPLHLFNPYSLRFYCIAQASLFFSLIGSGVIALLVKEKSGLVFILIAVNCTLHLFLDCLQIKWGNGVNLTAPFDWHLVSLQLLWPENRLTQIITCIGFLYCIALWRSANRAVRQEFTLALPKRGRLFTLVLLLSFYIFAPFAFFSAMDSANTYHLNTMRRAENRAGKEIAFDRAHYNAREKEITIYSGEKISAVGILPKISGRVSFQGEFINENLMRSTAFHIHTGFRDTASKIGLLFTALFLLYSLAIPVFTNRIYNNEENK